MHAQEPARNLKIAIAERFAPEDQGEPLRVSVHPQRTGEVVGMSICQLESEADRATLAVTRRRALVGD
jgi:hypothetical protein